MLNTLINIARRFRIHGAATLLPLYAFKAWTGKYLPFVQRRVIESRAKYDLEISGQVRS
jgi:hypothetical protein